MFATSAVQLYNIQHNEKTKIYINYGNILFIDGHVKGYAGADWYSNRGGTHLTDF